LSRSTATASAPVGQRSHPIRAARGVFHRSHFMADDPDLSSE
jgi:hypothetical protein